jgi:trk system potassium uptake protein TrkA
MRVAFVGATDAVRMTAEILVHDGHEVVLVDTSRERLEALSEALDCSFLCGDGTTPHVLRQLDPEHTDVLCCTTHHAQVNIIASLVGRSVGFRRVITSVHEPEFESICLELGLETMIVPERTISRHLADMIRGVDVLELSTFVKGDARFFAFPATEAEAGRVDALDLPKEARAICLYRDGVFELADPSTTIQPGDEVVLMAHLGALEGLRERWRS